MTLFNLTNFYSRNKSGTVRSFYWGCSTASPTSSCPWPSHSGPTWSWRRGRHGRPPTWQKSPPSRSPWSGGSALQDHCSSRIKVADCGLYERYSRDTRDHNCRCQKVRFLHQPEIKAINDCLINLLILRAFCLKVSLVLFVSHSHNTLVGVRVDTKVSKWFSWTRSSSDQHLGQVMTLDAAITDGRSRQAHNGRCYKNSHILLDRHLVFMQTYVHRGREVEAVWGHARLNHAVPAKENRKSHATLPCGPLAAP